MSRVSYISTFQGLQLSNTDYTVCVRMERNFCGIQYTACPDTGVCICLCVCICICICVCVCVYSLYPDSFSSSWSCPFKRNQHFSNICPNQSQHVFSSPANSPAQSFSVTGGSPALGSVVGTSVSNQVDIKIIIISQCSTDWITIPCATNTNDPSTQSGTPVVCVDRICGQVSAGDEVILQSNRNKAAASYRPIVYDMSICTQVFNSATTPSTSSPVPVFSKIFICFT